MKSEELKEALLNSQPVKHGEITYKCISAIIYRKDPDEGTIKVTAELTDKTGRSVSIAEPEKIEYVKEA